MKIDWEKLRALIIQSQKGDKDAYRDFLKEARNFVLYKVQNKVFNKDDVDDIVQDTLISIHKSLNTYDSQRALGPWMTTICERKVIDYIRKITKRNEFVVVDNNLDVTIQTPDTNTLIEAKEIMGIIPGKLSEPIELTKIKGLSSKEAAEELGINENALRTRVSRGLAKIKQFLEE